MSGLLKRKVPKSPDYYDALDMFAIMTVDGHVDDKEALNAVAAEYGFVAAMDVMEAVKETEWRQ